ncbi:phosphotyrosine protein phosphatase [Streptomyces sp. NPDC087219]|uniref:arsenate reductase/protein-tyrosine-phosphatase family protein n=1 Tax=Streptomyces sp. NPDC087219 TaxID=3365770 RepID=UPI00382CB4DE
MFVVAQAGGLVAGLAQFGVVFGVRLQVRSAGSAPPDAVNPAVVETLREVGVDVSAETPKVLTVDAVRESDVVITMGCGDACPYFPGKRYLDRRLDDPAGRDVAAVRPLRDRIGHLVRELLGELGVGAAAS